MAMSISDAHKALDKEYYKACANPAVKEPVLFALDKVFNKCGSERFAEACKDDDIPGQMNMFEEGDNDQT